MKIVGLGQIVMWPGGQLWIGVSQAPVEPHAHHAIQVSLGLRGPVRFRRPPGGDWIEHDAALVPSHLPHAFEAIGSHVATLFCEPESDLGRRLQVTHRRDEISGVEGGLADRMRDCFRDVEQATDADLVQRSITALEVLAGEGARRHATDSRVLDSIAEMQTRLDEPLRLSELADGVRLSPGRFRHLFAAETGIPFRRYLLWLRLQKALATALGGSTWTDAAHAANFADQAHLTRTFRQMLGVAPSALGQAMPLKQVFSRRDAAQ